MYNGTMKSKKIEAKGIIKKFDGRLIAQKVVKFLGQALLFLFVLSIIFSMVAVPLVIVFSN
jgi:hypothetical protein